MSAMLWNGVRQDAAIHGVKVHEAFEREVHGVVGFGSVLGFRWD